MKMRGFGRLALLILILCVTGELRASYMFTTTDYQTTNLSVCDANKIMINDPFPRDLAKSFLELNWVRVPAYSLDGPFEILSTIVPNASSVSFKPANERVSAYDFWGMSFNNYTQADAGSYIAILNLQNTTMERLYNVVLPDEVPYLPNNNTGINMYPIYKADGTTELVCACNVLNFGDPPIEMIFVHQNGTREKGRYISHCYTLEIDKKRTAVLRSPEEAVTIRCEVDKTKPSINMRCINLNKWSVKYTFQEKDRTNRFRRHYQNLFLKFVRENRFWILLALTILSAIVMVMFVGNYVYWRKNVKKAMNKNEKNKQEPEEIKETNFEQVPAVAISPPLEDESKV